MTPTRPRRVAVLAVLTLATGPLAARSSAQTPAGDLTAIVKAFIMFDRAPDWSVLNRLPGVRWTQAQPAELQHCLLNGDCYARQGAATVGGRPITIVAGGARTMVMHLLIRNAAAPVGEAALIASLRQAGLTGELARCPVPGGAGATTWYRLKGSRSGVLSIQTVRGPRPSEGFIVTAGDELPNLEGAQAALYTESCTPGAAPAATTGAAAPAGSTGSMASGIPHQRLAEAVVALLTPASAGGPAWSALPGLAAGITWDPAGPKQFTGNPMRQSGTANYGGRRFSAEATGTAAQVQVITLTEEARHPRGEHMLGVVYTKGIAVRLVRCGPVYTESTNNWYSLESQRTRRAMIRQSINYDGNNVSDTYELRLDGTLPTRDPRDRDPGVNGCQ